MNDRFEHDAAERKSALNATQSFIVQAPAGSGKTALLIQRVLTLLNTVNAPEEILGITFTKKAANEMRTRILKALKEALANEPVTHAHDQTTRTLALAVLARDARLNWHLIDNPNQLRIQTIDAFCSYLTKQLPLLSHFGATPLITDDAERLYSEAVQEVLGHVEHDYEWSNAIRHLLLHLDNDLNKLHELLIHLLAKRDQWLPYIHLDTSTDEIRQQLEKQLQAVISDALQETAKLFTPLFSDEALAILRFAADHLPNDHKNEYIAACQNLTALPKASAKYKTPWLGFANLFLTKSGEWRKRLDASIGFPALSQFKNKDEKALHEHFRKRFAALVEANLENDPLRFALYNLSALPDPTYNDHQWSILQALLQLLKIAAAQLRVTFTQHGQIDFIENARAALFALGQDDHPTDLALALDYQIKHILVDEFQDTSFTQYQLIEKLTLGWEPEDGRTLFVVGDPMQSIYRFREAEVGLFIRMRQNGIGQIKLTPLTLSVNFRSTEEVIDWNNQHFEKIFPRFSDMATGAVNYSASITYARKENNAKDRNAIQIKRINADEPLLQTHAIVNYIQSILADYPGESVAILVRSRAHLATLIPALKTANITYRAIDIDPLTTRQHIQDLLSLTRALLHPFDRIAWLAILRAPWCGLTLADCLLLSTDNPSATILEQLSNQHIMAQLSLDGQQRTKCLIPILKNALAERERSNLRHWIENTWLLLGGPAGLEEISDLADTEAFFDLLEHVEAKQLILSKDKLKDKINKLYANSQQEDAAVQIMTIHTAKGLEFDTVILPHLERKLPHDDKTLLAWMEQPLKHDQTALLLAPIHAIGNDKDTLYEYINRQQRIKANYEIDRLFYVATTRAKKRLLLTFQLSSDADEEPKTIPGSLLNKVWALIKNNVESLNCSIETSDAIAQPVKSIKRFVKGWANPYQINENPTLAYHQSVDGFILRDEKAKWIGTLTHKILQQLAELGIAWWQNQSADKQLQFLTYHLQQLGMQRIYLATASQHIQTIIQRVIQDDRGQWILSAHQAAQSEFSLTALINDEVQHFIIDRTFIDEDNNRWIIDYKTSTTFADNMTSFLHTEYKKYQAKMTLYANAMRLFEKRPIKLGLYFPAIPAWYEWENQTTIDIADAIMHDV